MFYSIYILGYSFAIQFRPMASILALLFLALSFSMGSLLISGPLITFANHNHNNSLIFIAVHTFLFFLIPFTFISAIILLLFHVAIPQSAFYIKKHFTMAIQVIVSATLLVGVPLMVHVTFTEAVVPDALRIMLIGMAAAMAAVYKYKPFKRYFNSASQTVGSFVPAFAALCISTGTFLLIDIDPLLSFSYKNHGNPLVPIPISLFLLTLNCFNFVLAVVLLFLYISVPTDGPQTSTPAVLVELLVEAVLAMSSTTIGLIGFYMVVSPLVRII